MSLAGLNILVTRPVGQADGLIAGIEQAAGNAHHYPVLAIQALDPAQEPEQIQHCKQQAMNLDHFQKVVFVSTNAVRFGMEWIHNYWPQLPVGIQWHAIGSSTAKALQSEGINVMVSGTHTQITAMNSEALLQQPVFQRVGDQKILIVRAVGGREHLKTTLTQRGASVSYLECYRRVLPDTTDKQLTAQYLALMDVVCVNSGESLKNLCHLAGDTPVLQRRQILVPSQRVADLAIQYGFKKTYVAKNASDKAILHGLLTLAHTDK